jgi:DNA-binding response OmpR family regulator
LVNASDILIVEDEKDIADVLVDVLGRQGHAVQWTPSGTEAMDLLRVRDYDLIILDWMLPGLSGVDVCKNYRRQGGQGHVLMLTARTSVDEKALALDVGADDYVCKPFDLKELLSRVKALLRRPALMLNETRTFAGWILDPKMGTLSHGNNVVSLLPRETELLLFLLKYPNSFFSAETLIERVWPASSFVQAETVRTHIKTIRKKLARPDFSGSIEHRRGYGYRIQQ